MTLAKTCPTNIQKEEPSAFGKVWIRPKIWVHSCKGLDEVLLLASSNSSMDKIVQTIQALSAGDEEDSLKKLVSQLREQQDIILSSFDVLPTVMASLDAGKHSLGYMFLLYYRGFLFWMYPSFPARLSVYNARIMPKFVSLFETVTISSRDAPQDKFVSNQQNVCYFSTLISNFSSRALRYFGEEGYFN